MSCYSDGDLLTYRTPKRRGGKGYVTHTGTVLGDQETTDAVRVVNHTLDIADLVPVEEILMHQPSLGMVS